MSTSTLAIDPNASAGVTTNADPNTGVTTGGTAKVNTSAMEASPGSQEGVQRPEGVPEKFWKDGKIDYDSMMKSYVELEKTLGGKPAPVATQTQAPAIVTQTEAPSTDAFDLSKFSNEFEEKGELSAESYTELLGKGYPKEVVDTYIQGSIATRTLVAQQLIDGVGGKDAFQEMCKAAKAAWTPEQLQAYEKEIKGPPDKIKGAVDRLSDWYTKEFGGAGKFVAARADASIGADGYKHITDIQTDMQNPLYATSPSFRAECDRKMQVLLRRSGKIR